MCVGRERNPSQPDYELLEVALPRLATVREEEGPAWLAHGDDGGSLVPPGDAKTGQLPSFASACLPVDR